MPEIVITEFMDDAAVADLSAAFDVFTTLPWPIGRMCSARSSPSVAA